MCGTIRPTKPIGPATVTAQAVNKAERKYKIICKRLVFTPKVFARHSPSISTFKDFDKVMLQSKPMSSMVAEK